MPWLDFILKVGVGFLIGLALIAVALSILFLFTQFLEVIFG